MDANNNRYDERNSEGAWKVVSSTIAGTDPVDGKWEGALCDTRNLNLWYNSPLRGKKNEQKRIYCRHGRRGSGDGGFRIYMRRHEVRLREGRANEALPPVVYDTGG